MEHVYSLYNGTMEHVYSLYKICIVSVHEELVWIASLIRRSVDSTYT